MRWSYNLERSRPVALWLFAVAALVVAMVAVGGATRLTGSGLSITQWKPVTGVVPPLSLHDWQAEFARYRRIPQFRLVNPDMTLGEFKVIYGWEWTHRLLARLVGLVFFLPFAAFLAMRSIPRRLVWRCWLILGLGLLQGLVGWWMVASGLEARISVAPERLASHLGLALALYALAVWTGWEAWAGRPRGGEAWAPPRWIAWAGVLAGLVYLQMLLGALVAGDQAGRVDTDWPLMNGALFPRDYAAHGVEGHGLLATLLHSPAAVQFDHRLGAYAVFALAWGIGITILRSRTAGMAVKAAAGFVLLAATLQVGLGIMTLMAAAPLGLAMAHQLWAVVVFTTSLGLVWRLRRS